MSFSDGDWRRRDGGEGRGVDVKYILQGDFFLQILRSDALHLTNQWYLKDIHWN